MNKESRNVLSKKRQDARELIEILDKIPEERKTEVLCVLKGFALCADIETQNHSDPVSQK